MDFSWTPEQRELRALVRDLAADRATSAQVRAAMAAPDRGDPDLWALLSGELGLTALLVPESAGGSGATFLEAAVVVEEAGRSLLPGPLASTLVATAATDDPELLDRVLAGAGVVVGPAPATGAGDPPPVPVDAPADLLLLAGPDRLAVVDLSSPGVRLHRLGALDPTRPLARVEAEPAAVREVGDGAAAATALDLLRVALAVEAVGVARWGLETTVGHLRTREQFDRPIGTFQALQHRVADLAVEVEAAASTAYAAAWAAAAAPEELGVLAPLALGVAADAAYHVTAETIQLHGGIGFTWEHDAHLYFKRATGLRYLLGDSAAQRRLVRDRAHLVG